MEGKFNICNMEKTKYNNDVPYERVVLRVLQNYSQMQIKLYRLQNKVKEQSNKLVFCNNVINQLKRTIKELNNNDDYKKVVAERDELLRKNKELSRQLKIYEGMRKYFNSDVSKLETDK